jgi:hypothetical protein
MRHLKLFLLISGVMFQDTYDTFSDADLIKTVINAAHGAILSPFDSHKYDYSIHRFGTPILQKKSLYIKMQLLQFRIADLIENTQRHYEIYSVPLAVCIITTAVKVM